MESLFPPPDEIGGQVSLRRIDLANIVGTA